DAPPPGEFTLDGLPLPNLLRIYLEWAGAVGNETPLSFHCFSFFWIATTLIGRRLSAETTWGQRIYPNLYQMIVAPSTYYRKSTACNLARNLLEDTYPFLLMPAPGSPERLLTSLAGEKPRNLEALSPDQQNEWRSARPFAGQRALYFDEVAGLLGALNRKEYMTGMKDFILEVHDCPPRMSRDTQNGLTTVHHPSLSILGVTTTSALGSAMVQGDWSNGLFSRFALITPETNYAERPALTAPMPRPEALVTGLRQLFERLPQPSADEDATVLPEWHLAVETGTEIRAYSQKLRGLCNPNLETPLDERLRPVYGRLHVIALKLSLLCAALRWLETDQEQPVVTAQDWQVAEHLAEYLRGSAHRLLEQLDRSGEASREMSLQDRVLKMCSEAGLTGCTIRELCRAFHTLAATTRDAAKELTKAGLLIEQQFGRTERYLLAKYVDVSQAFGQM
ncbi:MAG: DUF3987 domain-containing protein, partial [Anaerolineae bacterium]|nr:DUF3987 domain-containing protein [Anaerolineae bacterium]